MLNKFIQICWTDLNSIFLRCSSPRLGCWPVPIVFRIVISTTHLLVLRLPWRFMTMSSYGCTRWGMISNSFVRMCCFLHLHLGVMHPWICIDGSSHCRVDCRASAFFFSRELVRYRPTDPITFPLMVLKCLKCTWARGRRYHIEILEHLYQSVVWKPLLLVVSSAKRSVRSTSFKLPQVPFGEDLAGEAFGFGLDVLGTSPCLFVHQFIYTMTWLSYSICYPISIISISSIKKHMDNSTPTTLVMENSSFPSSTAEAWRVSLLTPALLKVVLLGPLKNHGER